jgi:hypothetical protein
LALLKALAESSVVVPVCKETLTPGDRVTLTGKGELPAIL